MRQVKYNTVEPKVSTKSIYKSSIAVIPIILKVTKVQQGVRIE
jgi:hypothetical protein